MPLRAAGRALRWTIRWTFGRNVVVLGLGLTGFSLARHLAARGATVRVADTRAAPPFADRLQAKLPGVSVTTGSFTEATFAGADMIAISPGVAKDGRKSTRRSRAAPSSSATSSSSRASLPATQNVLAITGSNGKTTVTALTGALVRAAGLDDDRRRQHRRRGARRAATRRHLAGRVRARAVELPAGDDGGARAGRGDGV